MPALRQRKAPSWIYYLRWEAKKHNWTKTKDLLLESGKLVGWPTQPVKRAHSFAWPPSSDEDSLTPPSSVVGPSTPEPQAPSRDNHEQVQVVDLIDFGPADNFAADNSDDGLQPPLQPDTKEVNLVSCMIDLS